MGDWRDPEILEEMYWEEGLSSVQIGEELGCSHACVQKWMDRHGIETRSRQQGFARSSPPLDMTHKNGYEVFYGPGRAVQVHRLLAVAEYGFDEVAGNEVHHSNGIRWDNRLSNIEVLTPSEHARLTQLNRWGSEGSDDV